MALVVLGLLTAVTVSALKPDPASATTTPTANPTCGISLADKFCVQATTSGTLQVYRMAGSWQSPVYGQATLSFTGESTGYQRSYNETTFPFTTPAMPADQYDGSISWCDPDPSGCYPNSVPFSLIVGPGATPNDCIFTGSSVGISSVGIGGYNGYYSGYLLTDSQGHVCALGNSKWYGDASGMRLNAPIIAAASANGGQGYWLLGSDGGVFSYGSAGFFGSEGGKTLNAPVVSMAPTSDNNGYWLVAMDGGVFTFGDAGFYGSMGGHQLNKPVDGMAVAPQGQGYWLVAADGGVFTFTSDGFYGSMGGKWLNKPVVGMSSTSDGRGYALVASDGGVFNFGDSQFYGSLGSNPPSSPVVDLSPADQDQGYYLITEGGVVYTFGPNAYWKGNASG